jgi:hypothetical protein
VQRVFQDAVLHVVQTLNGFMESLPNPVAGNPAVSCPVYPLYQDPKWHTPPAATVDLAPAPHAFGAGLSWMDTDDLTGVPSFDIYIAGCTLDVAVYSHHPGQAAYLRDLLYSGIVANYAVNPATQEFVEGAVTYRLAESGLTVVGLAGYRAVESDANSPRPYGQYYQIHLLFEANLDLMWAGGATPVAPIAVSSQVEADPSLAPQPGFGVPTTIFTVT